MQLPFTLLVEVSDEPKERIKQAATALEAWELLLKTLEEGGLSFTDTVDAASVAQPEAPTGVRRRRRRKVVVVEGPKEAA